MINPKQIRDQAKPVLNELLNSHYFIATSSLTTMALYKLALVFIVAKNFSSGILKNFFQQHQDLWNLSLIIKRTKDPSNDRMVEITGLKSASKLDLSKTLEELIGTLNLIYKNDQEGDAFQCPLVGSASSSTPIVTYYSVPLQNKLGEGAASTVYSSDWNGQSVALKQFTSECFDIYDDEMEILQFLDHPSIVKLLGIIDEPRHKALILEKADRGDLGDYLIKHKGAWREHLILDLAMLNITQAVAYFHAFRIIHGDLKPSNIVFDAEMNAKLIDFSMAGWLENGKNELYTVKTGNKRWSGPEFGNNIRTLEFDVYTIGVLLWITNTDDETDPDVRYTVDKPFIKGDIQNNLPVLPYHMNASTKNVVYRCWNFSPHLRPSATEVVNALKK